MWMGSVAAECRLPIVLLPTAAELPLPLPSVPQEFAIVTSVSVASDPVLYCIGHCFLFVSHFISTAISDRV